LSPRSYGEFWAASLAPGRQRDRTGEGDRGGSCNDSLDSTPARVGGRGILRDPGRTACQSGGNRAMGRPPDSAWSVAMVLHRTPLVRADQANAL